MRYAARMTPDAPDPQPPRPYASTEAAAANRARLLAWLLGTRAGRWTGLAAIVVIVAWMVARAS